MFIIINNKNIIYNIYILKMFLEINK